MHNTNADRDLALIRQDLADIKQLLKALIEQQKPQQQTTTTTTTRRRAAK